MSKSFVVRATCSLKNTIIDHIDEINFFKFPLNRKKTLILY